MKNTAKDIIELGIDHISLRNGAGIYRAINHSLRQKILRVLHRQGQMTVTAIFTHLEMDQSVISQHLSILRRADLVGTKREGRFIYYYVNTERLQVLHQITQRLIDHSQTNHSSDHASNTPLEKS
ncbi:MAG: ArsR/SmtB family transcription factor [Flavisolibacter sp.]